MAQCKRNQLILIILPGENVKNVVLFCYFRTTSKYQNIPKCFGRYFWAGWSDWADHWSPCKMLAVKIGAHCGNLTHPNNVHTNCGIWRQRTALKGPESWTISPAIQTHSSTVHRTNKSMLLQVPHNPWLSCTDWHEVKDAPLFRGCSFLTRMSFKWSFYNWQAWTNWRPDSIKVSKFMFSMRKNTFIFSCQ
jgi:hypothetical protein